MAKKSVVESASEIPADVIGAVVLADLAQIAADAGNPDPAARDRIIKAVNRLRDIAEGKVSSEVIGEHAIPEAA